jgi:hypothetical protein
MERECANTDLVWSIYGRGSPNECESMVRFADGAVLLVISASVFLGTNQSNADKVYWMLGIPAT